MDFNELRPFSGDDIKGEKRRQVKLTVEAMEIKMERFQKEQQTKVPHIKGTIKVKQLMQNKENASSVLSHLDNISELFDGICQLHESVIHLLP